MVVDMHAHFEPRMLSTQRMLEKLDEAGVERVVLIPSMNDPLPETPERLLAFARKLARSAVTRPIVEAIHRLTLTQEGDLRLRGRTYGIYDRPDNASVAAMCEAHPSRFAGWIFLNPRNNPTVLDELERWRSVPGMVGVKLHPHWHDYRTDIAAPLLRRAEELGLPVLVHLGFRARGDYRAICERFPKLTVIAAHAGFPFFDDLWKAARDIPNLHIDLSSPYLDETIARDAVKAIGSERVLYGTDAPYGFHANDGSYDYRAIRGWIERMNITDRDRDAIFAGNAGRLLRLPG
ncbi:MAG: amidohydrolase [Polyangiaceae bacterium]|nr:amidohydrolase [Polyangiaceae bacterium]